MSCLDVAADVYAIDVGVNTQILRAFRLLRVFKLLRSCASSEPDLATTIADQSASDMSCVCPVRRDRWTSLQDLLHALLGSLSSLLYLLGLLGLVLFIFGLLGQDPKGVKKVDRYLAKGFAWKELCNNQRNVWDQYKQEECLEYKREVKLTLTLTLYHTVVCLESIQTRRRVQ